MNNNIIVASVVGVCICVVISALIFYRRDKGRNKEYNTQTTVSNAIKTFRIRSKNHTSDGLSLSEGSQVVPLLTTSISVNKGFKQQQFFDNVNVGDVLSITLTKPSDRPYLSGTWFTPMKGHREFFGGMSGSITATEPNRIKGKVVPVFTTGYVMSFDGDNTFSSVAVFDSFYGKTATDLLSNKIQLSQVPGYEWVTSPSLKLYLVKN